ncbi:hypothetical protein CRQ32_23285 [Salmonella enterica]|nr:hypothetical protein [Salmonella enterica]EAU0218298.1 hypothetical protein [Salmonella enterica]MIP16638.1 hypothetical protein [Salmonella enterica]MIX43488.1 hypothetical protein [Salmonella enterica subsp. enterica serovar Senftenberg]MLA09437.1 hypothetical protein [Salmonella enterica subsp. enterica]
MGLLALIVMIIAPKDIIKSIWLLPLAWIIIGIVKIPKAVGVISLEMQKYLMLMQVGHQSLIH